MGQGDDLERRRQFDFQESASGRRLASEELLRCCHFRRRGARGTCGEWIAALDTIEALDPRAVIEGRKRAGRADDPRIIEETRRYIRDFDRAAETTASARGLRPRVQAMTARIHMLAECAIRFADSPCGQQTH